MDSAFSESSFGKTECMWKKKILPYFQYTRKERAGILVLLVIVLLLWIIPVFFSDDHSPISKAEFSIIEDSVAGNNSSSPARGYPESFAEEKSKSQFSTENLKLFPFDPNHTSEEEWRRLGLPAKTVSVIRNYLEKGGRFKTPDDLQKIYALKQTDFLRLRPFIRINNLPPAERKFNSGYGDGREEHRDVYHPASYKKDIPGKLDVNLADQAAWEKLNGIGEKLAARIVLFRDKLGGFHTVEQVRETFGISPELFESLRPRLSVSEEFTVNKINLNSASQETLKQHPYIGRKLAALIISYRDEHGPFSSSSDLQRIPLITSEIFARMEPYLSI